MKRKDSQKNMKCIRRISCNAYYREILQGKFEDSKGHKEGEKEVFLVLPAIQSIDASIHKNRASQPHKHVKILQDM